METTTIIQIANIFDLNADSIQYIKRGKDRFVDEYFTIKFVYKNIHVEILNMSDYMYQNYYDILVKKDIENQECMQTSIERLIAYYMEKKFNMKYTFENMIQSLMILKKFIDEGKLFFKLMIINCIKDFST